MNPICRKVMLYRFRIHPQNEGKKFRFTCRGTEVIGEFSGEPEMVYFVNAMEPAE